MNTSTVTSKGTVTLPAELRRNLGIKPGDNVEIFLDESGQRLVIHKRMSLSELRVANQSHLPQGHKPVTDAGEYWLRDAVKSHG